MFDQQTDVVNPKKLFVGNLPFTVSQETLQELFSQYGEIVNVALITDRMTGRSKGIAFIEYTTEESANEAIKALHNYELEGRNIVVSIARPPVRRDRSDFSRGPRDFDRRDNNRSGGSRNYRN